MSDLAKHDLIINTSKVIKSCFNFNKDLQIGFLGENYIKQIFENPEIKLEVKLDLWTEKTNRIAIEFESRGKPSGIMVTESDFWLHITCKGALVFMFPTFFLKFICQQHINNNTQIKKVGDKGIDGEPVAKCVLLDIKSLIEEYKTFSSKNVA